MHLTGPFFHTGDLRQGRGGLGEPDMIPGTLALQDPSEEQAQPPSGMLRLQQRLKEAARRIQRLRLEKEQLLELGNKLRAQRGSTAGERAWPPFSHSLLPPPHPGQRAGAAAGVRVGSLLENREQSICCAPPARSHGYRPALSAPGPPPGRVCERTAAGWPGFAFFCSFVGQQRLRVPRRWLGRGDKGAVSPGSRHCNLLRQGPPRVQLGTGRGSHGNSPCRQLLQGRWAPYACPDELRDQSPGTGVTTGPLAPLPAPYLDPSLLTYLAGSRSGHLRAGGRAGCPGELGAKPHLSGVLPCAGPQQAVKGGLSCLRTELSVGRGTDQPKIPLLGQQLVPGNSSK